MKTKKLTADAMLAAVCAVLGYMAIDTESMKVSFESIPIMLGAALFGPLDGFIIGGVGTFIYQLLKFGLEPMTILWMLPYMACGFVFGIAAKKIGFEPEKKKVIAAAVFTELLMTVINTGVLFIHAKLFQYYVPGIIAAFLPLRLIIAVLKGIIIALLLEVLIKRLRGALR